MSSYSLVKEAHGAVGGFKQGWDGLFGDYFDKNNNNKLEAGWSVKRVL